MGIMEKWTIKKDSINLVSYTDKECWTCDIGGSDDHYEVVTVWGKTKEECLSRAKKICKVNEMEAALKRVYLAKHFIGSVPTDLVTEIESLLKDLQEK